MVVNVIYCLVPDHNLVCPNQLLSITMFRLTIIVAATKSNGIGKDGGLPWRLSKEMKYFAQTTSTAPEGTLNALIMGRNTWESIPIKRRPLPDRVNIVTSHNKNYELYVSS